MALNIGELSARLTLETRQFNAALNRAQGNVAKSSRGMRTSMGGIGKAAMSMAATTRNAAAMAAVAVAAIGAAAIMAGKQAIEAQLGFEAMDRQMIAMAGSTEQANKDFAQLRDIAGRLGTPIDELASGYVKLSAAAKGTLVEGQETLEVLEALSAAGAVLGKSGAEMSLMFNAVSQSMSKGTIMSEELKGQLAEHLPMALGVMSRALGVSTERLNEMMESGALQAQYVWPLFAKQLRSEVGGAADSAAKGLAGAVGRMKMAWWDLMRALVTGTTEAKIGQEFAFMRDVVAGLRDALQAMVPYVLKIREYFASWGVDLKAAMIWLKPLGAFLRTTLLAVVLAVLETIRHMIRSITWLVEKTIALGKWVGIVKDEVETTAKVTGKIAPEMTAAADEAARLAEETKAVVDYTKQITDVRAGWARKFGGLEGSLEMRMKEATGTDIEVQLAKVEARRQQELEKIRTYYETQQKTLVAHQEVLAAATEEYERLRVRINQAANLEIEQAQAEYNARLLQEAAAAEAERLRLWEEEHQVLLAIIGTGASALSDFFREVTEDAGQAFTNFFNRLLDQIYDVVIQLLVIKPIMTAITEGFQGIGGGGGGGLFGIIGGLFGIKPAAAMADGGVITEPIIGMGLRSGGTYAFGERGPESVTPLGDGGGGAQPSQINVTIQALDAQTAAEFMERNPGAVLGPITAALQRGNRGLLGALRGTI